MFVSIDLSQEILAIDVLITLHSSLEHSGNMFCDRYNKMETGLTVIITAIRDGIKMNSEAAKSHTTNTDGKHINT